jgi:hypothetical protein
VSLFPSCGGHQSSEYLRSPALACVLGLSIAFDEATVQGQSFLDVRVRLCVKGFIENLHVLGIPLQDAHTGIVMANLIEHVMRALCGVSWKTKLVSIATNGARNMTGRIKGAITRFSQGTLRGFYRVWCVAHQLDTTIQGVVSNLCGDTFYSQLKSLIGHLRRQQNLVSSMKSTCPTAASTRWLSLGRVARLLCKHQDRIIEHLAEKQHAFTPPKSWWVLLHSIEAFMDPVDTYFRRL